jgi:hypothetical protein
MKVIGAKQVIAQHDILHIGGGSFNAQSKIDYNINVMNANAKKLTVQQWVDEILINREQMRTFTLFSKFKEEKGSNNNLINWLTYDSSDEEFIYCIINLFGMKKLAVLSLNNLHETLAKFFYDNTKKNSDDSITIVEGKEGFLHNYGPNLTNLKNLSWNDYNTDNIKGFCVYEPIVRIKQLLEYPIDKFIDLSIRELSMPSPPFEKPNIDKIIKDISNTKIDSKNKISKLTNAIDNTVYNTLIARIKDNKTKLISWESYYKDLVNTLEQIMGKLTH